MDAVATRLYSQKAARQLLNGGLGTTNRTHGNMSPSPAIAPMALLSASPWKNFSPAADAQDHPCQVPQSTEHLIHSCRGV